MASGRIVVEPLVTHRYALKDALIALDTMLEKEKNGTFKVVLFP